MELVKPIVTQKQFRFELIQVQSKQAALLAVWIHEQYQKGLKYVDTLQEREERKIEEKRLEKKADVINIDYVD